MVSFLTRKKNPPATLSLGGFAVLAGICLLLSAVTVPAQKNEAVPGRGSGAVHRAQRAATAWLLLVDQGEYARSWEEAAEYFRNAVPQKQWIRAMQAHRTPLGKTLGRSLRSARYTTQLPGAPDGEYVVLQFNTSFEHKRRAVETITPMKERDGRWRVSGYYIR